MDRKETNPTKVLFIWEVPLDLRRYLDIGLQDIKDLELIYPSKAEDAEYLKHSSDADIIVGWRPSDGLLDSAKKLRLFINPGAGVQHLIEPFRKVNETREVTLVNGHGNSYFTAQHAVTILLSLMNKVIPHHNWMVAGKWRRGDSDARSTPLRGRKVGLLGYGAVNQQVHKFLSGFEVEFSILKRNWDDSYKMPTQAQTFTPTDIQVFLSDVDILIIAVPQTPETIGLIGKNELEFLGNEGLLVNMARGVVVDEESLFTALETKTIAGAAIDVWYDYRPEPDKEDRKYPFTKPFHTLDNVVLSPHRGASPMDDLVRWNEVIENISRFTQGRTDFLNIVQLERGY
ncbi:MAG: NAD(P)-dependent oxidoreductase [Candidatus Thorarchaeota archaeon]